MAATSLGLTGGAADGGADGDRSSLRVVIADDQTVVRDGIAMVLGLLPGITVVGAAADGAEAVRLTAELAPDAVLMDLRMPRVDGVEATRRIRADHPGTQVVVLTTYADDADVFPALRAGARGYLTKDTGGEEIARTLRDVCAGTAGLSPSVQQLLLNQLAAGPEDGPGRSGELPGAGGPEGSGAPGGQAGPDGPDDRERPDGPADAAVPAGAPGGDRSAHGSGPAPSAAPPDGLTGRETEVLRLIAEGLSNQEIAGRLYVSVTTVKTHINNLFAKTGVRDRAQAVAYAYRHGLAPNDASR